MNELIKNEWFTIIEKLVSCNSLIIQNETKHVDIDLLLAIEQKRKSDLTKMAINRKKEKDGHTAKVMEKYDKEGKDDLEDLL